MKAYKGFKPQDDGTMLCRDKTYREGGTYQEQSATICKKGMHACVMPLDTLTYYPPQSSVYHEVEVDEDSKGTPGQDSKVVSKRLTVGARLGIAGMVRAQLALVFERAQKTTTGYSAHAATTGNYAHAATTGNSAHATTTGNYAHATTTGNSAIATTTGNYAHAATTGNSAIAAALGGAHAKASKGGWLILAEYRRGELIDLVTVQVGHKRRGVRVKADAWYLLRDGRLVHVNEDGTEVKK